MPSPLLTRCPHCGARFKLKDETAAGKKMKCRECETPFTIKLAKSATAAPAAAKSRAAAKSKSASAEDDADDAFDDFGDEEFGGAAPPPRLPPRRSTKKKTKPKTGPETADEDGAVRPARAKPRANIGGMVRIGGGSLLGVGVLAALFFVFFSPGEPIRPPASYGQFAHPKGSFSCEYPDGWEQEAGGDTVRWARWTKGDAKISIRMGAAGGALSDLATVGSDPNETDDSLKPEAALHESPFFKDPVVQEYSDYEELSVKTVQSSGMGGVRVSEFEASGVRGIRATAIGGQGGLRIVCDCRESDWDACKPIFERVIQSLSR